MTFTKNGDFNQILDYFPGQQIYRSVVYENNNPADVIKALDLGAGRNGHFYVLVEASSDEKYKKLANAVQNAKFCEEDDCDAEDRDIEFSSPDKQQIIDFLNTLSMDFPELGEIKKDLIDSVEDAVLMQNSEDSPHTSVFFSAMERILAIVPANPFKRINLWWRGSSEASSEATCCHGEVGDMPAGADIPSQIPSADSTVSNFYGYEANDDLTEDDEEPDNSSLIDTPAVVLYNENSRSARALRLLQEEAKAFMGSEPLPAKRHR